MKKSNLIIFIIIILVIVAIFGFAIRDANNSLNEMENANTEPIQNTETIVNQEETNTEQTNTNNIQTNINPATTNTINYIGEWYISKEAYDNAQVIDEILDRREENLITDQEFENQMSSEINKNIVELDVESYSQNTIEFDFKLISPAPTQREGKLEDVRVAITDNIGTFTYTDNWGTSGNGTITLSGSKIILKLETTSAAQGVLWGVEGIYTFSYKKID